MNFKPSVNSGKSNGSDVSVTRRVIRRKLCQTNRKSFPASQTTKFIFPFHLLNYLLLYIVIVSIKKNDAKTKVIERVCGYGSVEENKPYNVYSVARGSQT